MRQRLVTWIALVGLVALPAVARPEGASDKPAIAIRLASVDSLTADVVYLVDLLGKSDDVKVKNSLALLKANTGRDGIKGLDPKKPVGIYGSIGPKGASEAVAVLLLPVMDEDALVSFVGDLRGTKPEKGTDGIYAVEGIPVVNAIYARFNDGYCYISNSKALLAKDKLLAPAVVLPAGKVGIISATVQLDQIPDRMKQLVLVRLDPELAKMRDKGKPGESEEEAKLRHAVVDQLAAHVKTLLRDGGAVDLRVEVDRTAGDLGLSFSVAGKPGSEMAATISDLTTSKSIAASLVGRDSAASVGAHLRMPAKLKSAVAPLVDHFEKQALETAPNEAERELREIMLKGLKPTLTSGEMDSGFDLRGPNASGLYTLVLGGRVKEGEGLDQALRKIVDKLPDGPKDLIKLDADKAGKVAIHSITPPEVDANFRAAFGDSKVYLAIRDDAVLIAMGDKALEAIKEAIAASPKGRRIFAASASIGRLAPLLEHEHKGATEAAKKAFGADLDNDKVHLVIQGGESLQIKLTAKAHVLKFAAAMHGKGKADD